MLNAIACNCGDKIAITQVYYCCCHRFTSNADAWINRHIFRHWLLSKIHCSRKLIGKLQTKNIICNSSQLYSSKYMLVCASVCMCIYVSVCLLYVRRDMCVYACSGSLSVSSGKFYKRIFMAFKIRYEINYTWTDG